MKKFGTIGKKNIQWNLAKKVGTKDSIMTDEKRAKAKKNHEKLLKEGFPKSKHSLK